MRQDLASARVPFQHAPLPPPTRLMCAYRRKAKGERDKSSMRFGNSILYFRLPPCRTALSSLLIGRATLCLPAHRTRTTIGQRDAQTEGVNCKTFRANYSRSMEGSGG